MGSCLYLITLDLFVAVSRYSKTGFMDFAYVEILNYYYIYFSSPGPNAVST